MIYEKSLFVTLLPPLNKKNVSNCLEKKTQVFWSDMSKKRDKTKAREKSVYEWTSFCGKTMIAPVITSKEGKDYAYVTLLFPNPNNIQESPYMVGNIMVALGLRRLKTKADLVCLVTPDVDKQTIKALKLVYDHVHTVPYLRPHKTVIKTFRESYLNMFTKLHIFDSKLLPYKKVCFVDSDILPLRNYDAVFDVQAPAGIIEPSRNKGSGEDFGFGHRCDVMFQHGHLIPKRYTDLWNSDAGDVNAGLLVVEPDHKEFMDMLAEISRPAKEWLKPGSQQGGYYDHSSRRVKYHYTWPEQQYLTNRYSGKWHSIGYEFGAWCIKAMHMNGVHYVPFSKMPWLEHYKVLRKKEHSRYDDLYTAVPCLQLFYVIFIVGVNKVPQLKNNERFMKYTQHVWRSIPDFLNTALEYDYDLYLDKRQKK